MSPESNKAVVRRYFEAVHNARQESSIAEIFSPELAGPTANVVARMVKALPDYRIEIQDQLAEGDKVATIWRMSGTHSGDWESPIGIISASGNRVSFTGTTTFRLEQGRIVEVIGSNHDHLGLLQQMGTVPAVAARAGA